MSSRHSVFCSRSCWIWRNDSQTSRCIKRLALVRLPFSRHTISRHTTPFTEACCERPPRLVKFAVEHVHTNIWNIKVRASEELHGDNNSPGRLVYGPTNVRKQKCNAVFSKGQGKCYIRTVWHHTVQLETRKYKTVPHWDSWYFKFGSADLLLIPRS